MHFSDNTPKFRIVKPKIFNRPKFIEFLFKKENEAQKHFG